MVWGFRIWGLGVLEFVNRTPFTQPLTNPTILSETLTEAFLSIASFSRGRSASTSEGNSSKDEAAAVWGLFTFLMSFRVYGLGQKR